jgi:hypothetical protein
MVRHYLNDLASNDHWGEAVIEDGAWEIAVTPAVRVPGNSLRLVFAKPGKTPRIDLVIDGERRSCNALWKAILLVQGKPIPKEADGRSSSRTDQRLVKANPGTRR